MAEPAIPDEPVAYSRGATVAFERAQAIRVAVGLWLAVLVTLVVVFSVTAVEDRSRSNGLARRGTPVDATITRCVAVASGTGETVYQASCRATYTLGGQTHEALIHGMTRTYLPGASVAAVVDPSRPSSLSSAASVAGQGSSWSAFIPAGVTALILLLSLGVVYRNTRRGGGRSVRSPLGPAGIGAAG